MLTRDAEENYTTHSLVDRPQRIAHYADGHQPSELPGTFPRTAEDSCHAARAIIHANAPLRGIGHIQVIRWTNRHASYMSERQPGIEVVSSVNGESCSWYLLDLADQQHCASN